LLRNDKIDKFVLDVLRLSDGRLAIADIHSHDIPSLLGLMRRDVPKEERWTRSTRRR